MSLLHRTPIIVCLLVLATLLFPGASRSTAQVQSPSLAIASMTASPFGTVAVTGEGFTPGGLVRVVIQDLWGHGPTVDFWLVTPSGTLDARLPYLSATIHGPHGSQDPAQGYVAGTLETTRTAAVHGPNGSQDPALGYAAASVDWPGGCPDLTIRGWDARTDSWSNALDVRVVRC